MYQNNTPYANREDEYKGSAPLLPRGLLEGYAVQYCISTIHTPKVHIYLDTTKT